MQSRAEQEDKLAHAREQAESQYSGIVEMVNAVECDYDRLEELKAERNAAEDNPEELAQWDLEHAEELKELTDEAGDCENQEDAYTRIQEDPLSVEVRSGWVQAGDKMEAEEFCILLCTGGPAVRIRGELGRHNEPSRAWIEYQDWYTPWTEFVGAKQDVLLTYSRQFFYGE